MDPIKFYLENYAEDLLYSSFIKWLFTTELSIDSMAIDSYMSLNELSSIKNKYDSWYHILNNDTVVVQTIVKIANTHKRHNTVTKYNSYLYEILGFKSILASILYKIPNKPSFLIRFKVKLIQKILYKSLTKKLKKLFKEQLNEHLTNY